ncbi:hypothetical protein [Stenotrophomonas mori]|uniref:Uncharacterized protein n=1 Tax=Stenotrophomonas mori TaxID=2871096 RepID=A0ABT0SD29_9GAMM|nr:hypothetical protein [Stenotrophomonas mori]MCL7713223.1 hypothetical protein [Stenotrophomonas mori]
MKNTLKAYCLMTYLDRHPMAEASIGARIRIAALLLQKTEDAIERHGVADWEKILHIVHKEVRPLARYDLETDQLAKKRAETHCEKQKEDCDA